MSLAELRAELRYAIAFQVLELHPEINHGLVQIPMSIVDVADQLLNLGIDRPVLIELSLNRPSSSQLDTETLRRIVLELELNPQSVLQKFIATQIICAVNLRALVLANTGRETQSILSGMLYRFFTEFDDDRVDLINALNLGWMWQVEDDLDQCFYLEEHPTISGRSLRSAEEITSDAHRLAAKSLADMPEQITGPA